MNALLLLAAGTAWASSFQCPHPRYEAGMAAATREAEALSPEEAARALARLKERSGADGVDGRLGFGALLAVRAQGVELSGGVYCDEPSSAADPIGDRWVGVEAKDGRRYRLTPDECGKACRRAVLKAPGMGLTRTFDGPDSAAVMGKFLAFIRSEDFLGRLLMKLGPDALHWVLSAFDAPPLLPPSAFEIRSAPPRF